VALLFKKLMGVFTGSAMQRQGHCRMINARAITFGARTGLSSFLRHPSPTALYFMSLRQTGTPLATGMPFGTESPLFQRTRWRRRPGFGRGFHGKDVHRECPLWVRSGHSVPTSRMSALPQKRSFVHDQPNGCFWPKADIGKSVA